MNRFVRIAVMVPVLALGLALAGCESFDPTDLTEMFNTKKKLPGERKPIFPEGTPGVPQGVPADLVKGYQPPAEPEPQTAALPEETKVKPKPKAKPKPKPKMVANPPADSQPTPVTVRPTGGQPPAANQWPDPPAAKPQQPGAAWPDSPQKPPGQVAWPDPPAPGSFSR
jgi:hypothetical protein